MLCQPNRQGTQTADRQEYIVGAGTDPEQLDRDLVATGLELGVEVSMRVLDPDVL